MHDDRFDDVARALGRGRSRRAVLAGLFGGAVASAAFSSSTNAARRGYAGPFRPKPVVPSDRCPSGTDCQDGICCAPDGSFCAGSGTSCTTTANCPASDEICYSGQCWLACSLSL